MMVYMPPRNFKENLSYRCCRLLYTCLLYTPIQYRGISVSTSFCQRKIPPSKLEVEPVIKNLIRTNEFLEISDNDNLISNKKDYSNEIEKLKSELLELKEFNKLNNQQSNNNPD